MYLLSLRPWPWGRSMTLQIAATRSLSADVMIVNGVCAKR